MLRVCDNDSNLFLRDVNFPRFISRLPSQDSHLWGHKLRSCDRSVADRDTQRFLVPWMSGETFCRTWALFVDGYSLAVLQCIDLHVNSYLQIALIA